MGCKKEKGWDCLKPMGDVVSEERVVPAFNGIKLTDKIDLDIVPSAQQKVEVSFGEFIVNEISTEVSDGVLSIENRATCNWVRRLDITPRVTVHCDSLVFLRYAGTGNITFTDTLHTTFLDYEQNDGTGSAKIMLESDSVTCKLRTGVGDLELIGHTFKMSLFADGVASIDASQMANEQAYMTQWSIRDVYIQSSGYLYAAITSRGNIYYSGTPDLVDLDDTGPGELIPQ